MAFFVGDICEINRDEVSAGKEVSKGVRKIMAISVTFHEKLYIGGSIETKKLGKIKKKLTKAPFLAKVFLILPASNLNDQLDILEAKELAQPHYRGRVFLVLGIASDKGEAMGLVEHMATDCVKARGDCNLREYMAC